jgi:hypothetical protein
MAAASPGPSLQVARHDRGFLPAGRAAAKDTSLRSARPRLLGGPVVHCLRGSRGAGHGEAGAVDRVTSIGSLLHQPDHEGQEGRPDDAPQDVGDPALI